MKLRYSLQIALIATLILLGSCGGKGNKVNSNAIPGVTPTINQGNSPLINAGPLIVSQYNSVRSSIACLPGRTRLINDAKFHIDGGAISGTTVGGNWQPGFTATGSITEMFVGVSIFRDLMFLLKVTNGSQVIGYNLILSYCDVANTNPSFPLLLSNERALTNFQAPYGITINTATSCGYGLIASAMDTLIISQPLPSNPLTYEFRAISTFTKPNCQ